MGEGPVAGSETERLSLNRFRQARRKARALSPSDLVKFGYLEPDRPWPRKIEPAVDGVDLMAWARDHRSTVEEQLTSCGGLLFRGFQIGGVGDFERFFRSLADEVLDYSYRSTPRTQVSGKVYTSTEYPADQQIPLHNEMSYSRRWPMKIWFYCVRAAEQGGATPLADSRAVYKRIAPETRRKFEERGVMYVRNYGGRIDLSWQNVFQTDNQDAVEAFCRRQNIEFEWLGKERLRTRQVCAATAAHPRTGDKVWFNQAHLFHVSSLAKELRVLLLEQAGEEGLPRHAFYGDGGPIEEQLLEEIREAYRAETVAFPWQEGDILMLDNMMIAHGREPFVGQRRVVVGMAEPAEQE